jgi:hypothetical protein
MRRFTMTFVAAAAAIAAIAVVTLPAIGDSGTKGTSNDPGAGGLAACLAAHGLPGAPTGGLELKQWLGSRENQRSRVAQAAMDACQPSTDGAGEPGPDVTRMIACVRSHGIDAPTAPEDFKRWLGDQANAGVSKALDSVLRACKLAVAPPDKSKDAGTPDCGGASTDKSPATKPQTPGDANGT